MTHACCWHSPVGWLAVIAGEDGISEIACHPDREHILQGVQRRGCTLDEKGEAAEAIDQIREFFDGKRRTFSLRTDFGSLSAFTTKILKLLSTIPFGTTVTYGGLASLAGSPGAARAVGRAMATNPFIIVYPCHRVLGAGGRMTGYSGGSGISTKEWLLAFESREAHGEKGGFCLPVSGLDKF